MASSSSWADHAEDPDNALTILLYHGVTDRPSKGIENFSGKHIEYSEFRAQMEYVRKRCVPLTIDDVVALKADGRGYPARSVVVTFDDGFQNNYTTAAPILDSLGVPTVFYVSSGMINTDLMFWVDKIEDCVNHTQKRSISIRLDGSSPQIFSLDSASARIDAVQSIKAFCKAAPMGVKDRVIGDLVDQTGITPHPSHAENYPTLTWTQLRAMAENPLFTIGGHSLYHDILAAQPVESMQCDIDTSLGLLTYNLKRPIRHFSYPEGQANHFDEAVISHLKKRGVICSPSALHGVNPPETDLFHLRRIIVGILGSAFPFQDAAAG